MVKYQMYSIGELCNIVKGSTGLASAIPGIYPLVTTSATRRTSETYQFDTEAVCIPLVSSSGHGKKSLNYIHYQKGKFALGTILVAIIPKDKDSLSASYLHRYLQFYKDRLLVSLMKGAANVTLPIREIAKITIPLPPISDQRRIEKLINRIDELNMQIEQQKQQVEQLLQTVLREAFEGS